jgi:hypothetical protein
LNSSYFAQQRTLTNSKRSGCKDAELNGDKRDEQVADVHGGAFVIYERRVSKTQRTSISSTEIDFPAATTMQGCIRETETSSHIIMLISTYATARLTQVCRTKLPEDDGVWSGLQLAVTSSARQCASFLFGWIGFYGPHGFPTTGIAEVA